MTNTTASTLPQWVQPYDGPQDPQIHDDLAADMWGALAFYEKYHDRVATLDASEFLTALKEREALTGRDRSPELYAEMEGLKLKDDKEFSAFVTQTHEAMDAIHENLLFWDKELQALDSDRLTHMLNSSAEFDRYRPYVERIRRFTPYQLDEAQEHSLFAKGQPKAEKRDANKTYETELAALRFFVPAALVNEDAMDACEERGDYMAMTDTCRFMPKEVRNNKTADDEALRRAVYEASWKAFEEFSARPENSSVALMNRILAARKKENDLRGFERPDSATNLANDMEDRVIDTLRSVVKKEGYALNQRYLQLKARVMGQDRLQPWDELAPLPGPPEEKISWEEAKRIALEAFEFSPQMHEIAQRAFDNGWIDAAPRAGKHYGAFSSDASDGLRAAGHPYLSLHFTGKPRDVLTLTHELGHAIQDYLTTKNQGDLMSDISVPFAETASTFAETLVFSKMINEAKTDEEKISLLDKKISEMLYSITRQIAYDDFEMKIHREFAEQGPLSAERFGALWKQSHRERIGDIVIDDPRDGGHEWALVPQIFKYEFYVHGYAFGELMAASLYKAYENAAKESPEKAQKFKNKYLELLKAGSTEHHDVALTKRFGSEFDISQSGFWSRGLSLCEGMIDELETLIDKRQAATPTTSLKTDDTNHAGRAGAEPIELNPPGC